jgi:hypothetical protein
MRNTIYQSGKFSRTLSYLLMALSLAAVVSCGGGGGSASVSYIDSTIKLPDSFTATKLVEGYSGARHIAVAPNGAVFV